MSYAEQVHARINLITQNGRSVYTSFTSICESRFTNRRRCRGASLRRVLPGIVILLVEAILKGSEKTAARSGYPFANGYIRVRYPVDARQVVLVFPVEDVFDASGE